MELKTTNLFLFLIFNFDSVAVAGTERGLGLVDEPR